MKKLNRYIMELLGTELRLEPLNTVHKKELPFYIRKMFNIKRGFLFDKEILLLEQKAEENLTAEQYRKHITLLENTFNLPAVLVLEQLEAYNRKRLIEKQIAFIIPGKQMYIPQLLIDLREFRNTAQKKKEKLQPAAQCILLYHLLKEDIEDMNFKLIAEKTNYTQMTITRGAKELADKQLCRIDGTKEKRIVFNDERRTLWNKALPYLQNPVKRKIFIDDFIDENLIYKSGLTALSYFTDLAGEQRECFAISKTDYMYLRKQNRINITNKLEGRICLEIWKYAPGILSENRIVDPLSLYLTFKDIKDERIEMETEKMVNKIW
ncbi:hypothetical protein BMS3Abin03_01573 [bacterium BMS3Abin03]|nr:hypothetical protein BMS3Abin03_01573 [bacterium BMS3Abin03]